MRLATLGYFDGVTLSIQRGRDGYCHPEWPHRRPAGAGSDFTAQIAVTVNYALTGNAYVSGGYRYVHLDYEKRGALLDIRLSGLLLGFTWRFG